MKKRIGLAFAGLLWGAMNVMAQCTATPVRPFPSETDRDIVYTVRGNDYVSGTQLWLKPNGRIGIVFPGTGMQDLNVSEYHNFLRAACNNQIKFYSVPRGGKSEAAVSSSGAAPYGQVLVGVTGGDFNGDGVPDQATVGGGGVIVTLYNADGTVYTTARYPLPYPSEQGIDAEDFNGDGNLDLVVLQDPASGNNGSVAVLLGKGDGTFSPAATVLTGVNPEVLTVADFNGDGKQDVGVIGGAKVNGSLSEVFAVLLGKGDGTFGAPMITMLPVAHNGAAVDVTGDGKVDLVIATPSVTFTGGISVFPGNGDGTFKAAISSATGANAGFLAYADLNGDGKVDYVIGDQTANMLYVGFGNGDGSFQSPQRYVAASHLNSVSVMSLQDGTTAILMPDALASESVLAFSAASGRVGLPAVQTLGTPGHVYPSVAVADLNGDGKMDILASIDDGLAVELGKGDGSFAAPVIYPAGLNPASVSVADLNRDGKPDALVMNQTGASVFLNNGDGTLRAGALIGGGPMAAGTLVDLDGDGNPDLVVLSEAQYATSGTVSVLMGKADGTFGSPKPVTPPAGSSGLGHFVAGDFNSDGKQDLIAAVPGAADFGASPLAFYPGNGDGTFGTSRALPGTGSVLTSADLNHDGHLDLVAADGTNTLGVMLGNGDGTFSAPVQVAEDVVGSIVISDIDGNGELDLVLGACCGNAEASYLLGNGDGTFGARTYFVSGPNPTSIAVADFTGAGVADLAIVGGYGFGTLQSALTVMAMGFPRGVNVVSPANPAFWAVAPGSLATAYGADLAVGTPGSTSLPLPESFGGTTVSLTDSAGNTSSAPLLYVAAGQVNFEVPDGVASGVALVTITSKDGTVSQTYVEVSPVAPGVFTINSAGLVAANVLLVSGANATYEDVFVLTGGAVTANPVSLGGPGDQAFLILYGTGLQAAGTAGVKVTIGGVNAAVTYGGKQGTDVGLDQVNVLIPPSLKGKGTVTVQLTANGFAANPVTLAIQ